MSVKRGNGTLISRSEMLSAPSASGPSKEIATLAYVATETTKGLLDQKDLATDERVQSAGTVAPSLGRPPVSLLFRARESNTIGLIGDMYLSMNKFTLGREIAKRSGGVSVEEAICRCGTRAEQPANYGVACRRESERESRVGIGQTGWARDACLGYRR